MTIAVLSVVVLAQIALFQFMSAFANRSLILQELRSLDGPVPDRLAEHSRRAPIVRMALGTVLGCLALLPLTGLLIGPGFGKLLLVVVSITSAIAFAFANARDRKMMRLLVDHLPGGGVRRASLEPRSLRQWYHPALESSAKIGRGYVSRKIRCAICARCARFQGRVGARLRGCTRGPVQEERRETQGTGSVRR